METSHVSDSSNGVSKTRRPRGPNRNPLVTEQLSLPIDVMTVEQICNELRVYLAEIELIEQRLRSHLEYLDGFEGVYEVSWTDPKTVCVGLSLTIKL